MSDKAASTDHLRATARSRLSDLLARVMQDGTIDQGERRELQVVFQEAVLTVGDVREVFGAYLKHLAADVLADGVVTEEERRRCRHAVEELKIPLRLLSPELQAIVRGMSVS